MLKTVCILLIFACLLTSSPFFAFGQSNQSETLTITTYYPSPYGVYRNLEVRRGISVGGINTNLQPGQMYINGSIILNSLSAYPSNPRPGQLIYFVNNGENMLKFWNTSAWVNITNTASTNEPEAVIIPPTENCPAGYTQIYHWPSKTLGGGCAEGASYCSSMGPPAVFGCFCYSQTCTTPEAWSTIAPSCGYSKAHYWYGCHFDGMAVASTPSFDKSACLKND